MSYKKIESIEELKKECNNESYTDFFMLLAGGIVRSSKEIMYDKDDNIFHVLHNIDDCYEELTEKELIKNTNIGNAIKNNAFYKY